MSTNQLQDVIIIGGGPGGSAAGGFLAQKGYRVTIFEKEKFPRDHVGESLLPFCYNIFKELGLLDQLKGKFVRKPGVRFVGLNGMTKTTWCFRHVIQDETYLSFQVARGPFDEMLLNNAARLGATVRQETRVESVNLNGPDDIVEVTVAGPDGRRETHRARFLIDASGRNAFMSSRLGGKKKYPNLDRTAIWTHYEGANLKGGLEEGLSLIIYIGGEKKGWMWIFPLSKTRLTVGVVMSNDHLRAEKAQLIANGSADWAMDLFLQELQLSPFARRVVEGATIVQDLTIEGDYSYYVEKEHKYSKNYALIGDASQFIDPIFSSGVYLAMNSARLVVNALDARLTNANGQNGQAEEAMAAAYKKIAGAYSLVYKLISFFYNNNAINWAQMESASDLIHKEHESAMAVGHFLLAGDFFDRYDKYAGVLDMLQNPNLYNVYKAQVINRADFSSHDCEIDPQEIFHAFNGVNGAHGVNELNGVNGSGHQEDEVVEVLS